MAGSKHSSKRVGSATDWLIMRSVELFMLFVAVGFLTDFAHISWALRVGCLVEPCVVLVYFHNYAWGYADERGLTFRRYVRKFYLPWEQRADWNVLGPNLLVVRLERPVILSKTIKFTIDMTAQDWARR